MKTNARSPRASDKSETLPPHNPVMPPPPPPKPELNIYEQYTAEAAAIYAGRVTPPDHMYQPTTRMDMKKVIVLGVLRSQMGREFFSLQFRLAEQAAHLPRPRSAGQVAAYKKKKRELLGLASDAAESGWKFVYSEFPAHVNRSSIAVLDGWTVVREPDFADDIRQNAKEAGYPEAHLDTYVQRRVRDKELKEQEVTFGDLTSMTQTRTSGSSTSASRAHPSESSSPEDLMSQLDELVSLFGEQGGL